MSNNVIHKIDHHPGCAAVDAFKRGDWTSPWFFKGDYFSGDKAGRQRGTHHRWFIVRCNDPDCPALRYVDGNWLEEVVENREKAA